jgi:SAM-dependent methyltransferase
MSRLTGALLEQPGLYRLWQAPFARAKLEPFLRHNDLGGFRRVLDVGCGPGTNARYFVAADYLGIDINPLYVAYARRRFPGKFEVADAAQLNMDDTDRFDCIFVNSLLHHLDDSQVRSLFGDLRRCIAADGAIHILDLVRPVGWGIDALLARADRGHFSRPGRRWEELVKEFFELVVVEPYSLRLGGMVLWNMIYVKGRPR